jgi:hypothetical protein
MLYPLPLTRHRFRARRDDEERVPRVPPEVHVLHPADQVPAHLVPRPAAASQRAAPEEGDAGPDAGRRAPSTRSVPALLQELPVVPVQLLPEGVRVRQVPRRWRGAPARVGEPHDLRLVLAGEQLPAGGLRDLPPHAGGPERRGLLGGRQGHEGQGEDEQEGQEEVQAARRCSKDGLKRQYHAAAEGA